MRIFRNFFLPKLQVKISNETDLNLENTLKPLLQELLTRSNVRKLRGKEVEIIIPKQFAETVYKWACDAEKEYYDVNGSSEANGHFSTPLDYKSEKFKIIINSWTFDEFQYFSTVVHEFTHVLDFNNYIRAYGNPVYMDEETKQRNYYYEFYFWTEFNAKKLGMIRYLKELEKKDKMVDLESTSSLFIQNVNQTTGRINQFYQLVHFFARISACQEYDYHISKFDSKEYPSNFIRSIFGNNALVIHTTMDELNSFKDFQKQKDFLKYLFARQDKYFW